MNEPLTEPLTEPRRLLLRRRDVMAWTGISVKEYHNLVDAGVLKPRNLKRGGRAYLLREEVRRALCLDVGSEGIKHEEV